MKFHEANKSDTLVRSNEPPSLEWATRDVNRRGTVGGKNPAKGTEKTRPYQTRDRQERSPVCATQRSPGAWAQWPQAGAGERGAGWARGRLRASRAQCKSLSKCKAGEWRRWSREEKRSDLCFYKRPLTAVSEGSNGESEGPATGPPRRHEGRNVSSGLTGRLVEGPGVGAGERIKKSVRFSFSFRQSWRMRSHLSRQRRFMEK